MNTHTQVFASFSRRIKLIALIGVFFVTGCLGTKVENLRLNDTDLTNVPYLEGTYTEITRDENGKKYYHSTQISRESDLRYRYSMQGDQGLQREYQLSFIPMWNDGLLGIAIANNEAKFFFLANSDSTNEFTYSELRFVESDRSAIDAAATANGISLEFKEIVIDKSVLAADFHGKLTAERLRSFFTDRRVVRGLHKTPATLKRIGGSETVQTYSNATKISGETTSASDSTDSPFRELKKEFYGQDSKADPETINEEHPSLIPSAKDYESPKKNEAENHNLTSAETETAVYQDTRNISLIPEASSAVDSRCNKKEEDTDRAIAACTKIIDAPAEASFLSNAYDVRGFMYLKKDNNSSAMYDFQRAIDLDRNNDTAQNNLGVTYRNQKQYERAIAHYTIAMHIDPSRALYYINRAYCYHFQKRYDLVVADYEKVIELVPGSQRAVTAQRYIDDYRNQLAAGSKSIDKEKTEYPTKQRKKSRAEYPTEPAEHTHVHYCQRSGTSVLVRKGQVVYYEQRSGDCYAYYPD